MDFAETVTIHANASGRLWHEDPERWQAMCTPQGCPWCQGPGPPPDEVFAETDTCWVTGRAAAAVPGYACVSTKIHAVEPYELDAETQHAFWIDAMLVARGVAEAVHPVKMNYEIHGNTVPHVHMHLFPRSPADAYVGYPVHSRFEVIRSPEELAALARAIRAQLAAHDRLR